MEEKLDNHDVLYKWLQIKINEKYNDIDVKNEFYSADLPNGKLRLNKSYSENVLSDDEKTTYLNSLHRQLVSLTSVQDVRDEIEKMSRQDNKDE